MKRIEKSNTTMEVYQHWSIPTIILSYVISVTGSYCSTYYDCPFSFLYSNEHSLLAIQMMEQWRIQRDPKLKIILLILSGIILGGCGIWCTHFTGMNALTMVTEDGTTLEVDFDGWLTLCSLVLPIAGVFVGLKIGSRDPFFLEIEQSRRKQLLVC